MRNLSDPDPQTRLPRLLMVAPAPVIRAETGFVLDAKFIEGMALHARQWPGALTCVLREGATHIPFGAREVQGIERVDLQVLEAGAAVPDALLEACDLVFCSADDARDLDLPARARALGVKSVFSIEYIFQTRLQIAWYDRARSLPKRLYSMLWLARQERRLRRAMRHVDGLQANGFPAYGLYGPMAEREMLYLDNRMTPELFVTDAEMSAKAERLQAGGPLRLVYSGRLEAMKGAHDLVPIAALLRERRVAFQLDIFGDGSLRSEIAARIAGAGLENDVHLHDPVDFETELVPWLRAHGDVYLCCHRQSDPSCTYVENMGCGLAVAGFGNQMWSALQSASGAGWVVPMGKRAALADMVAGLTPEDIATRRANAVAYAHAHDFPTEFGKRMEHLIETVDGRAVPS